MVTLMEIHNMIEIYWMIEAQTGFQKEFAI